MSRSRFPKPSVRVLVADGEVLSLARLRGAGVRVDDLIAATGVTPRHLEAYVSGEKRPTLWLQRVIAQAVGVAESELWPPVPSDGFRGSLDDRAGRRASERNVSGGASRGAR